MPNLEIAKMPDDLDIQEILFYSSIQTGAEEIIVAFSDKQDYQNFFENFSAVLKVGLIVTPLLNANTH